MDKTECPVITLDLLEYLKKHFPDKSPSLKDLQEPVLVQYKSGQVSVVRHLQHQFDIQNETILVKES